MPTYTSLFTVSTVVAVLVSMYSYRRFEALGSLKTIHNYNNQCTHLPGPVGCEDMVLNPHNGILFVSSDDKSIFKHPISGTDYHGEKTAAAHLPNGGIYYVNTKDENPTVSAKKTQLSVEHSELHEFHPHGITLSADGETLYTVSHGTSGELVVAWHVHYGLDKHTQPLLLQHKFTVRQPPRSHLFGLLNDVTAHPTLSTKDKHVLYVSNSLANGLDHPYSALLEIASNSHRGTVIKCTVEKKNDKWQSECHAIVHNMGGPNGIHVLNDGKLLVVAETFGRALQFYALDAEGNVTSSQPTQTVHIDSAVDNIIVDHDTGDLLVAGHSNVLEFMRHGYAPQQYTSPTEVFRVKHYGDGKYASMAKLVLAEDGKKLSGVSVALPHEDQIYLGSVMANGLLVCPVSGGSGGSKSTPAQETATE